MQEGSRNHGSGGSDLLGMVDPLRTLQRESRQREVARQVGWYQVTVFAIVLVGVALIAYARATAP